jgi:hypothetical protein
MWILQFTDHGRGICHTQLSAHDCLVVFSGRVGPLYSHVWAPTHAAVSPMGCINNNTLLLIIIVVVINVIITRYSTMYLVVLFYN